MEMKEEYDSSTMLWKNYKVRYSKKIDINTDILHFSIGKDKQGDKFKRYKGYFSFQEDCNKLKQVSKKEDWCIELAGDCFFNINQEKISELERMLDVYEKRKVDLERIDVLRKKLNSYKKNTLHHSPENCVLMPVTGGMNNVKGNLFFKERKIFITTTKKSWKCFDRPDVFVVILDEFFENRNKIMNLRDAGIFLSKSILRNALNSENYAALYDFLSHFSSAEEFCGIMFNMDKSLFEDMKKNGKIPIEEDFDGLEEYFRLAEEFWKQQKLIVEKDV